MEPPSFMSLFEDIFMAWGLIYPLHEVVPQLEETVRGLTCILVDLYRIASQLI
jgi:hypothetical protein